MEMSLREEELSGTIQSVDLKNLFLSVDFYGFSINILLILKREKRVVWLTNALEGSVISRGRSLVIFHERAGKWETSGKLVLSQVRHIFHTLY